MAIALNIQNQLEDYLVGVIRKKLENYHPETDHMPFHHRLLGKDRMALFSFIHSLNTTLGMSIFEQIAAILAKPRFATVIHHYKDLKGTISSEAVLAIDQIFRNLNLSDSVPSQSQEFMQIFAAAKVGTLGQIQKQTVDLFLVQHDGVEIYIEIKSAKPNIKEFAAVKRQLLEWAVIRASSGGNIKLRTIVAIPYNPYAPQPYERFTLKGLFDMDNQVLIAEDFWNFIGGEGCYESLLELFTKVGKIIDPEISTAMQRINS